MAPVTDLAALSLDDLVDRQAVAYRLLADVQGEIARRSAQQPATVPDRVLRIREACQRMGWTYSWAVKHWREVGGFKDLDGGLKIRAGALSRAQL